VARKSGSEIPAGHFDPLSPDEELVAAICENAPQEAAQKLRELDSLGRYALDALADMLDGGTAASSRQLDRLPVALKIIAARGRGRPSKGVVRSVVSRPSRQRKTLAKSPGWEYMMALRVQRFIDAGYTRTRAIEEARQSAHFAVEGQKKRVPPSASAVEKAYDRYRRKLRTEKSRRMRRVLK
jgi:hypothetical protein